LRQRKYGEKDIDLRCKGRLDFQKLIGANARVAREALLLACSSPYGSRRRPRSPSPSFSRARSARVSSLSTYTCQALYFRSSAMPSCPTRRSTFAKRLQERADITRDCLLKFARDGGRKGTTRTKEIEQLDASAPSREPSALFSSSLFHSLYQHLHPYTRSSSLAHSPREAAHR
jgi:hypothetical protein